MSAVKERLTALPDGKSKQILETIANMSVMELADFKKDFETVFDVTAAAMVAPMAGGGGGAAAAAPAVEEKTTFDAVLVDAGAQKIQVIKEVRAVTNLGLKEAKDLVDGAPKPIKTGVSKEEAETIKKKVEAAGAKVEIK